MSSNIKVAIRVRPLISREKSEKLKEQWEVSENAIYPIDFITGKRNGDAYHFDHIFDSTCCNADIYSKVVHPVVDKAMNGFNGTVFAYGQTSSGKTYTMMGNAKEDGLISMAVQNVFFAIEQSVNRKFLLRVSYMEIYNEKIYDLLDIKNTVKISEDCSGSVIVNLKEEVTDCADKIYDMMKKGDKARRIGETNMNEKSSRSHTIFRIIIESSDINDTGVVNVAHLNLVDLAGSERATHTKATGQRLKEGAHINKSLSTLGLVMKQLSESQDFINFRDSKLTRILQSSLGGNALTAIIAAITPAALEETHSTLQFASRAKTIKNKPLINEIMTDEALINKYVREIKRLKKENINLQGSLQEAQKIAMLERNILSSKNTHITISNKNRRKTWSAPQDARGLPIIYETDVLSTDRSVNSSDNLESEICPFPFDDFSSDGDRSTTSTDKKLLPWTAPSSTLSLTPSGSEISLISSDIKLSSASSEVSLRKPEELVRWLVHSSDTPKSVLRERAEYYEHEFKSLKELTTQEKLLLTTEHSSEMEMLSAELEIVNNELKREKNLRKDHENNIAELTKKLNELVKINEKLQRENDTKNDSEFLAEMYKEKYKKREKELLDSLEEARGMLKSKSSNTDSEKVGEFLNKFKNQSSILKFELESNQPVTSIQNMFLELKKLNDEMLNKPEECSDEIQDILKIFKYIFDIVTSVLLDDTLIVDLERQKQQLLNREKTYELLVSKQDEEIKHLSENILQYMTELESHKNELAKYKDQAKSDVSFQTNLDFSVSLNDSKNLTGCILDSDFNKTETTIKSDQTIQTEEDISSILKAKDKEIEDLSDKIMEYIDQLTAVEQELNKLKSVPKLDQLIQTDILMCNDIIYEKHEFEEIEKTWNEKINSYQELLLTYESQIEEKNKMIDALQNGVITNGHSEDLNSSNYEQQIRDLEEEVKLLKDLLENEKNSKSNNDTVNIIDIHEKQKLDISLQTDPQSVTEKTSQFIQTEKDILVQSKDKEIEELSDKLMEYLDLVSTLEKDLDNLKIKNKEELENKDKEIEDLSAKLIKLSEELSAIKNDFETYKLTTETEQKKDEQISDLAVEMKQISEHEEKYARLIEEGKRQIDLKNQEIEDLSAKIAENSSKLSLTEEELQKCMSQLTEEKDQKELNNQKIEQLTNTLSELEKEMDMYKIEMELKTTSVEVKTKQIEDLSLEVIELTNKLTALESEMMKYKTDFNGNEDLITEKDKMIQELLLKISAAEKTLSDYQSKQVEETDSTSEEKLQESVSDKKIFDEQIESKNKEIERLSSKIVDYVNQLLSLEAEVDKYKSELKKHEELLQSKDIEIEKLSQKDLIESKNTEIKKLTANIDDYVAQLSSAQEEIKSKEDITKSQNEKIQELSSNIMDYLNQLSSTENEIKTLKDLMASKDKEIEELSSNIFDYMDQLTSTEDAVKLLEDQLNIKNTEIEILSTRIDDYMTKLSTTKDTVKVQEDELNVKSEEIVHLSSKVDDYIGKLSTAGDSLKILEDQINMKNEEIEKLSSEVTEYKIKLSTAKEMINNQDTDEKINKLEEEIKIRDDQIKSKNNEIENLSSKLEDYKKELSFIEEKLNACKMEYSSLEGQIESKNKEIEELSSNILDYINQLTSVKEKLTSHEANLNTQKDLIDAKDSLIKKLSEEVSMYLNQISSKDEQLQKFESQYDESQKIITSKNDEINTITKQLHELNNTILQNKDDINKLRSELNIKQEIVIHKENDIKNLNEVINHYTQNFENVKHDLLNSASEEWKSKLQSEQQKSVEYLNKIKNLEEQMLLLNQQANQMKLEYESLQNSNLQYSKANENLQKQICALQGHISQQVGSLKQQQHYVNQLEEDKKKILENTTLIRNTSMNEIQKLTEKLQEKRKYVENLNKELVKFQQMAQNSDSNVSELATLKKKNEEYRKKFELVTEKANTKIASCNAVMLKLKQDNEFLKIQNNHERESNQKLQTQLTVFQAELEKKSSGAFGTEILKLQTKINDLEEHNNKLVKVVEDYQEKMHKKTYELGQLKKKMECAKRENSELEEMLQAAKANAELLEKENSNYSDSARVLEESLEDVKFELYELKNKEKEKIKKLKRQSLHDSSRSLSSDEHLNIVDENLEQRRQSFEPLGPTDLNSENIRLPFSGRQLEEQRSAKLQIEYEKLRKKYDQLFELCRIRKTKIEELEKHIHMFKKK